MSSKEEDDIISYKSVKEADESRIKSNKSNILNVYKANPHVNKTMVNDEQRDQSRKESGKAAGEEGRKSTEDKAESDSVMSESEEDEVVDTETMAVLNEMESTAKAIYNKNEILELIKAEIKKRTDLEIICKLKTFYNNQYNKLQALIIKAIILQNKVSHYSWPEIPISTRLDEDRMILQDESVFHSARNQLLKSSQQKDEKTKSKQEEQNPEALKEQTPSSTESVSTSSCSDASPCIKSRLDLQSEENSDISAEENCMHKLNSRVDNTESENNKLFFHMSTLNLSRYSGLKDIEKKIAALTNRRRILIKSSSPQMRATTLYKNKLRRLDDEISKLCRNKFNEKTKQNLKSSENLQNCRLICEVQTTDKRISPSSPLDNRLDNSTDFKEEFKEESTSSCQPNIPFAKTKNIEKDDNAEDKQIKSNIDETEQLKRKYVNLLLQYDKLAAKLSDSRSVRSNHCNVQNEMERLENLAFKGKINELLEERKEFKYILKEQENQLEEYRQKYLDAQQTIEEKQCMIEQLETSNKKIDSQLHTEIDKLESKLQKKVKDLAVFPKLLENERSKLEKCSQENEDLIRKLCIVCNELKAMKARFSEASAEMGESPLIVAQKMKEELQTAKQVAYLAERDRGMLTEELLNVTDQLNTLRSKTAAILARTNERVEKQKEDFKNRINKLEKELSSARAQTSRTVTVRDEQLREAEDKMEAILCKYQVAQAEIKTLRTRVYYLTDQLCCQVARTK